MAEYILGINNGSRAINAGLYSDDGVELLTESCKVVFESERLGYFEVDPEQIFASTVKLVKKLIAASGVDARLIKAVGFAGHSNGMYMIDEEGEAVSNGLLILDKRAKSIADEWYKSELGHEIYNTTYQRPWSGMSAAFLKWYDRNRTHMLERVRWLLFSNDYLRFRFTGEINLEVSSFSNTGLYDIKNSELSRKILNKLGLGKYEKLFPEIIKSDEICGCVTDEIAAATGLEAGTPVVAGLTIPAAGAIASGITAANYKKYINVFIGIMSICQYLIPENELNDNRYMVSVYPDSELCLNTRHSATSSNNLQWFAEGFLKGELEAAEQRGESLYDFCDKAVSNTTPMESDVIFLPYLYHPSDSSDLNGTLLNIGMNDTRDNIIRAVYEGVVFALKRSIMKLLLKLPEDIVIRVLTGTEESAVWWQMLADVTGRNIEVIDSDAPGAMGVAICAGLGVGMFDSIDEGVKRMVHVARVYYPDPELYEIYSVKYQRYVDYINEFEK